MVTYNAGVTSAEDIFLCNDYLKKYIHKCLGKRMCRSHPWCWDYSCCETVLLTHRLLAVVRFKTLRYVVVGSCFEFLQGLQQFLLLPEEKKDHILSSTASSPVPDLQINDKCL